MITDPKTSMKGRKEQILWALAVVLVDLWLHTRESLSTLFYALFLVSAARLVWMHGREFIRGGFSHWRTAVSLKYLARVATITFLGTGGYAAYAEVIHPKIAVEAGFRFEPVPLSVSGISSKMSNILQEVDPRVQHIAKWLLSVGGFDRGRRLRQRRIPGHFPDKHAQASRRSQCPLPESGQLPFRARGHPGVA